MPPHEPVAPLPPSPLPPSPPPATLASSLVWHLRALIQRLTALRGHTVVHNVMWLYLVQFSGYLIPLLTLPYLSRVLSVEKFGLIAYAQSIVWNFVILTEYGFNLTATRAISVNRDRPEALIRTFSAVMAAKTLLTAAGVLILMALVFVMKDFRSYWPLFLISFLSVVGYLLFPLWLYQGLEMMKQVAIRDFLAKLISFVALFTLVRNDGDYLWAAFAQSSGLLLAGLVGLAGATRLTGVRFGWPTWKEVTGELQTAWAPFLSTAAGAIAYAASVFLVGWRSSPVEIGYFNAAARLASLPRSFITPITTALFSNLSRRAAASEVEAIRFVERNGKLFITPFFFMSLLLAAVTPWLVPAYLGAKYTPTIGPLLILSWGPFLSACAHIYSTYYMLPCGYDKIWSRIMLINAILSVVSVLPLLSVTRGAMALAISLTVMELTTMIGYRRFYMRQKKRLLPDAAH